MKISVKKALIISLSGMFFGFLYAHISFQREYKDRKVVEKVIVGKRTPQYYILFEEDGKIIERQVSANDYIYYQKDSTYTVWSYTIVWR